MARLYIIVYLPSGNKRRAWPDQNFTSCNSGAALSALWQARECFRLAPALAAGPGPRRAGSLHWSPGLFVCFPETAALGLTGIRSEASEVLG